MKRKTRKAILRSIAGLVLNLSSGWFGAILIVPNFSPVLTLSDALILIYDLIFGSIFLLIAVLLERKI